MTFIVSKLIHTYVFSLAKVHEQLFYKNIPVHLNLPYCV